MKSRDSLPAWALAIGFYCGLALASSAAEAPQFHYQPSGAIFGDPIPFHHQGVSHVFYLYRPLMPSGTFPHGSEVEWRHLTSRDWVHWQELPPALSPDARDQYIATGSIVEKDGRYYAFYATSGVGDHGPGAACIRVATSSDLMQWTKQPGEPVLLLRHDVPGSFDPFVNWRDPGVFWNPAPGEWWMAIAAHERTAFAYPYSGAIALATSRDLSRWTVRPKPLLSTREGPASECPDIFRFGPGWAMVYYSDTTRIRLADTPGGPWRRPANDAPWGLLFDAGKTEYDGRRRIVYAYLPRTESDYPAQLYGGVMSLPRELYLDSHGQIATRLLPEIIAACADDATGGKGAECFSPQPGDRAFVRSDSVRLEAESGGTGLALWRDAPDDLFLTCEVTLAPDATLAVLLRGNSRTRYEGRPQPNVLDDSYALVLDPRAGEVRLQRQEGWQRLPALRTQPIDLPTGRPIRLHLMLQGSVLEAFVDDRISLSARVLMPRGALAFFARDGAVSIKQLKIAAIPPAVQ